MGALELVDGNGISCEVEQDAALLTCRSARVFRTNSDKTNSDEASVDCEIWSEAARVCQ